MIEGIIGFIAGVTLNWLFFILCAIFCVVFDHNNSRGWSIFSGIVLGVVSFFFFDISWAMLGWIALAWIPTGIIYSIYRWKRHCDNIVKQRKANKINQNFAISNLNFLSRLDIITYWAVFWPVSLVESIFGDIIDAVQFIIKKIADLTYRRISKKAIEKITVIEGGDLD